jgi:ABC-type dipeptide/oligopeptide/nickel transport system permease subunit
MPSLYFLASDYLLWFLVILIWLFIRQMLKNEPTRQAWKLVFKKRYTQIATGVLLIFMSIALLDSIHLNINSQIESVLDILLRPISGSEQSYSAPLSTHLFDKNLDGTYTKLNHTHLLGTSKIGEDVLYQSLKSIRTGFIIGSVTTLFMLPIYLYHFKFYPGSFAYCSGCFKLASPY